MALEVWDEGLIYLFRTFFTSAWRLYTIVATSAATYPTIDFTFLSPLSIILSALEIDLAICCASMPIFWPVVLETWGRIFVETEVRVSVHQRDSGEGKWGVLSGEEGDGKVVKVKGKEEYYKDRFVREWGDPLGHEREGSEASLRTYCEGLERWKREREGRTGR